MNWLLLTAILTEPVAEIRPRMSTSPLIASVKPEGIDSLVLPVRSAGSVICLVPEAVVNVRSAQAVNVRPIPPPNPEFAAAFEQSPPHGVPRHMLP